MYHIIKTPITQIKPLPNSDNLVEGIAAGYKVIVSKNTPENTSGILFLSGTQVDLEFAKKHNLLRKLDENGKNIGGYFEENCRVRNIKLRGTKTEAFWLALDSSQEVVCDDNFEYSLGQEVIGRKYIPPTFSRSARRERKSASFPGMKRHYETCPFKLVVKKINEEKDYSEVIITEKLHGTSARIAKREVPIKFSWWQKIKNWVLETIFFQEITKQKPEFLVGTRNCIITENHPDQYRWVVPNQIKDKLKIGECIYGEIIGWSHRDLEGNPVPIMPFQETNVLSSKKKNRNDVLANWTYGLPEDQSDFYVYRITMNDVDLSFEKMRERCLELGLKTVPVIATLINPEFDFEITEDKLLVRFENEIIIEEPIGGPSVLSDSVQYREGLCLRFEKQDSEQTFKLKSYEFGVLEGYLKDKNIVDVEESS